MAAILCCVAQPKLGDVVLSDVSPRLLDQSPQARRVRRIADIGQLHLVVAVGAVLAAEQDAGARNAQRHQAFGVIIRRIARAPRRGNGDRAAAVIEIIAREAGELIVQIPDPAAHWARHREAAEIIMRGSTVMG